MATRAKTRLYRGMTAVDPEGRLLSYVVVRDYGFAPNPFFGSCTLATCKPGIRRTASEGDWIVGTTGSNRGTPRRIVFVMKVTSAMTFNEYWRHPTFQLKRPDLRSSLKYAFGDNIYHQDSTNCWRQLDSHHSHVDGRPNVNNIRRDTQADRVLISTEYRYWGGSGPEIPCRFREFDGYDIVAGRNYKSRFPKALVRSFVEWITTEFPNTGYLGEPGDW